jgi:hypothetical protein
LKKKFIAKALQKSFKSEFFILSASVRVEISNDKIAKDVEDNFSCICGYHIDSL